jgi:hypothetical protein
MHLPAAAYYAADAMGRKLEVQCARHSTINHATRRGFQFSSAHEKKTFCNTQ